VHRDSACMTRAFAAAADRVQLPAPRYDRYVPYVSERDDDVVELASWQR
jgi:hypothetical protein